jgi:hypothetical protein
MKTATTWWHSEFSQLEKERQIELITLVQKDAIKGLKTRLQNVISGYLNCCPEVSDSSKLAQVINDILNEY